MAHPSDSRSEPEIQSHRASPVQHDQQELGRRTAHQLRENSEVHPHHHHQYGAQSAGLSGSQELPRRRKAIATEAASVAPHTIQSSSQMNYTIVPSNVK